MNLKPLPRGLIAVGACALVLTGYAAAELPQRATPPTLVSTGAGSPVAPIAMTAALPDFSALVDSYGKAVVNITVTGSTKTRADMPDSLPFGQDDRSPQSFRRFAVPMPAPDTPTHGVGSGFIVSPDGVILTNAHVVDGANEVTVKLTDRREFTARVIGKDAESDVAVLKIEASGLPTVKLGNSSTVRVGAWVAAIGSPFGFESTVTSGIVSAKARRLPNENYVPFLQTDVPVNPGNSGGPLFNMQGEVIGINSQIYSHTGGFQGMSFAVPIDLAVQVKDQLQHGGHVVRGRLGASIQDVNQQLADSFGLARPAGALISSVDPDGPAARAGLQAGDVIQKLDGQEISQAADLPARVAMIKPGSRVQLEIWRQGSARSLTVAVGELHAETLAANAAPKEAHGRLGLALHPAAPGEGSETGTQDGLVVDAATGPAAAAGIEPGDIVLAFNGTPVHSVEQLRTLVAKAGKHAALLVQHQDARMFVPLDLG